VQDSDRVWREHALRRAVLAGDEHAWQTLYDEAFAGLYAYVGWRCAGLRDRTDEAVQETWLTAVRRLRDFDPDRGSFAGWLRGIAANVLRKQLRVSQRNRVHESLRNHDPIAPPADAAQQERDTAERIARALAALPEHYEAVLRAKYLDEQSVSAIAEQAGETPKAIESLLTRARQAFREAYQQLESPP
jgi:RNA polymerase sigma-70 factor (ECF subfamily)